MQPELLRLKIKNQIQKNQNKMSRELNLYGSEQPQGLNGLWGWIKKNLDWICPIVAVAVPVLAPLMAGLVFMDEDGGIFRNAFNDDDPRGNYQPTAEEDKWLQITNVEIKDIVISMGQDLEKFSIEPNESQKLILANNINFRGDFVLWFYQNYKRIGLSQQAIDLRSYLIEKLLSAIYSEVDAQISVYGYAQTPSVYIYPAWSQINELRPYYFKSIGSEITYPTWQYTKEDEILVGHPTDTITELPTTTIPVETTTNTTTPQTNCPVSQRKFYDKWWVWVLAGMVGKKLLDK